MALFRPKQLLPASGSWKIETLSPARKDLLDEPPYEQKRCKKVKRGSCFDRVFASSLLSHDKRRNIVAVECGVANQGPSLGCRSCWGNCFLEMSLRSAGQPMEVVMTWQSMRANMSACVEDRGEALDRQMC